MNARTIIEANYGPASLNPDMFDEFVTKVSNWVLSTIQSGELKQGTQRLRLMLGDTPVNLQADADVDHQGVIYGSAIPGHISQNGTTYFCPNISLWVSTRYFTTHAKWLKTDLQSAIRHELTHIFQGALHMSSHRAAYKGMPNDTSTQKVARELTYLSDPVEAEAMVQSVIGELDTSKDFSTALNGSDVWSYYKRVVFHKYPKLRSKMLSKIAAYWNQRVEPSKTTVESVVVESFEHDLDRYNELTTPRQGDVVDLTEDPALPGSGYLYGDVPGSLNHLDQWGERHGWTVTYVGDSWFVVNKAGHSIGVKISDIERFVSKAPRKERP